MSWKSYSQQNELSRLASPSGMLSLQEMQSQTQEELGALLPSVQDRAFKGEL